MKIKFDKDGITEHCPRYGIVDINFCRACNKYRGECGFEVWCIPAFDELPPDIQEHLLEYWKENRHEEQEIKELDEGKYQW